MPNPLVSVVIATRNRANLLNRAIESVLSQTLRDFEVIVIDDASTDETPSVITSWQNKDNRVRSLRNEVNSDVSKTVNEGLRAALGKYIAILDDDDYWVTPEKLSKQTDFLEKNPEYVGVGGGMIVVDQAEKELFRFLKPRTDEEIRRNMLFSNPMASSTVLFRKSAGEKAGFYDESFSRAVDRDFWLRLGRMWKLYNLPEYLACYQMGGQNTLFLWQRPHLKSTLRVMRRYRKDYPHYWPALALHLAMYGYSFLPAGIRRLTNNALFYLKRKVFDRVPK